MVDGAGRNHLAFGSEGTLFHTMYDARRGAFDAPAIVGRVPELSLGMRRGPRIASAGKTLVVAAIGGAQGKGRDGDLLAWRSEDLGASWTGPTRVNKVEGSAREGLHTVVGRPDGTLFAAWLDLRNKRTEIWGATSRNGGVSWDDDRLVYQNPERSVCECCHPSAAFGSDGSLNVMWRNNLEKSRDLYLVTSRDGGRTFGTARQMGRGHWIFYACPMDGGAVSVGRGGRVEAVWMRDGSIFCNTLEAPERRLGRGVQPWITSNEAGAYTVWLERRPGRLFLLEPGAERPRVLANGASDPVIAASSAVGAPVVVAWETIEGGIDAMVLDVSRR